MSELKRRFGRLLRAHRSRRRMTQDGLAHAADISIDMVSRLESGAVGASFNTIEKLTKALGIDAAQLFSADLPEDEHTRSALNTVLARLSRMSAEELVWADRLLDLAIKRPR